MKFNLLRLFIILLILSTLLFAFNTLVLADEQDGEGFYVGFNVLQNSLTGDFNGQDSSTISGNFVFKIPKLKDATGVNVLFGEYFNSYAGELNYSSIEHITSYLGASLSTATFESLSYDIKVFTNNNLSSWRGYWLLGMVYSQITAKDAVHDTAGNTNGDCNFTGYGLDGGIGLLWHQSNHLAFDALALYRQITYGEIKGMDVDAKPKINHLNGSGLSYSVGIRYLF